MIKKHKKVLKLSNHMQNLVGQPYYGKTPSTKRILEELINGMISYGGVAWLPVEKVDKKGKAVEYKLMLNQCPGACGHVWYIPIINEDIGNWLVNELNQRKFPK